MNTYIPTVDELQDRLSIIRFVDPEYEGHLLALSTRTVREHIIPGWISIAILDNNGRAHPIYDIWIGFENERLQDLIKVLNQCLI